MVGLFVRTLRGMGFERRLEDVEGRERVRGSCGWGLKVRLGP